MLFLFDDNIATKVILRTIAHVQAQHRHTFVCAPASQRHSLFLVLAARQFLTISRPQRVVDGERTFSAFGRQAISGLVRRQLD